MKWRWGRGCLHMLRLRCLPKSTPGTSRPRLDATKLCRVTVITKNMVQLHTQIVVQTVNYVCVTLANTGCHGWNNSSTTYTQAERTAASWHQMSKSALEPEHDKFASLIAYHLQQLVSSDKYGSVSTSLV